jgi:hypothetical protein
MHAHAGMMLALHGGKPIPEYDSSKERHWRKRKLKSDQRRQKQRTFSIKNG